MSHVRDFEVRDLSRVPPHSVELEQLVLGAIMLAPDKFQAASDLLVEETFYLEQHRIIYGACFSLLQRGVPCDFPSVLDELRRTDKLEKAGGAGYVTSMVNAVPSAAHVEHHAGLIAEKAALRRLIKVCTEVIGNAFSQDSTPEQVLEEAERNILDVTRFGKRTDYDVLGEVMMTMWKKMSDVHTFRKENPDVEYFAGIRTHFVDLDKILGGFHPGSLNILAARPSVGKSSLALNTAVQVAQTQENQLPVLIFSLEMPSEMLALRMLSSEAKVPVQQIETAEIAATEWHELAAAFRRLEKLPILLNDASSLTVRQIAATARRVMSMHGGISMIVVDYLQLMRADGRQENRVQEVSSISRGLKTLALELRVPILACSQLSRQVEQRKEHKPVLSDLRESGSIEQDADVVMFLSYYSSLGDASGMAINTPEYAEKMRSMREQSKTTKIYCTIAKNRNGPIGDCPMLFLKDYCKFETGDWGDFKTGGKQRRPGRGGNE